LGSDYIIAGDHLIAIADIRVVDFTQIENLHIIIYVDDQEFVVEGIQAIDCLMQLRPSALENRRLRWAKNAWVVHNLIGHPVMQVLAFFRKYDWAMWVHDKTVPRPKGAKVH
jgi:hypothetical protein